MKLFTFSGISSSLAGVNAGLGVIELANHVVRAMAPDHAVAYAGVDDVDHFRSYVNFAAMVSQLDDLVRLSGSTALNNEAREFSPQYARAMADAMIANPDNQVIVLAHSQGTNNLVWTLI